MPNIRPLLFAVALLASPAAVQAQTVARSFDELRSQLTVGQPLTVKDETGRTIRGRIVDVLTDSMVVETRRRSSGKSPFVTERVTFTSGPLEAVLRRDGLGDGILLGGVVGLGAGWLVARSCGEYCYDAMVLMASMAATVPGGIAIGAIWDALERHPQMRVEYPQRPRATVRIAPALGRHTTAMSLAVQW